MARHPDADRPIDTSVRMPSAVTSAGSRADALMAQARGEVPPGTVVPPAPQPPGKEVTPPAPQPAPVVAQPPAEPPPHDPAPQNPTPATPPLNSDESWEMRYRSMKGRHDVFVEQSNRAIADLNARLDALQAASPPVPATPAGPTPTDFDEEDDNTWGPDFKLAVQRRIDAAVKAALGQVNGIVAKVEQHTDEQRKAAMDQALNQALPGGNGSPSWIDLNADPQFLGWLELRDPLSGAKRLDMLRKAYGEFDAQRVYNFFASFISEAGSAPVGGQPGQLAPAPNGELPPPSNRISLASLAAPGPTRPAASAPPLAPQAKRTWTHSEIGAFFNAKSRGQYEATPELRAMCAAYEADIFAAQAENRTVPG